MPGKKANYRAKVLVYICYMTPEVHLLDGRSSGHDFIKDGKINFGATIRALIFEQLAKMIYHQMRANLRCSLIHILLY